MAELSMRESKGSSGRIIEESDISPKGRGRMVTAFANANQPQDYRNSNSAGFRPPPDPKRQFLKDDYRDDCSQINNSVHRGSRGGGGGGFPSPQGSQGRSHSRGDNHGGGGYRRGGGGDRAPGGGHMMSKRELEMNMTGRERHQYMQWREERDQIDRERMARMRSDTGNWRREWDQVKVNQEGESEDQRTNQGENHDDRSNFSSQRNRNMQSDKMQFSPPAPNVSSHERRSGGFQNNRRIVETGERGGFRNSGQHNSGRGGPHPDSRRGGFRGHRGGEGREPRSGGRPPYRSAGQSQQEGGSRGGFSSQKEGPASKDTRTLETVRISARDGMGASPRTDAPSQRGGREKRNLREAPPSQPKETQSTETTSDDRKNSVDSSDEAVPTHETVSSFWNETTAVLTKLIREQDEGSSGDPQDDLLDRSAVSADDDPEWEDVEEYEEDEYHIELERGRGDAHALGSGGLQLDLSDMPTPPRFDAAQESEAKDRLCEPDVGPSPRTSSPIPIPDMESPSQESQQHSESLDAIERDMIATMNQNIMAVEACLDGSKSEDELDLIYGLNRSAIGPLTASMISEDGDFADAVSTRITFPDSASGLLLDPTYLSSLAAEAESLDIQLAVRDCVEDLIYSITQA